MTEEEIDARWKELMAKTNPADAKNADEMLNINNGRRVLKDAVLREQYNVAIDYWKIVDGVNCAPAEVDF